MNNLLQIELDGLPLKAVGQCAMRLKCAISLVCRESVWMQADQQNPHGAGTTTLSAGSEDCLGHAGVPR